MKILEVKNNLVKISYKSVDDLVLSGFVIIEDAQYPYVAQIMSLKADNGINYAIAKLLFTFDANGVVKNYNGSVPELDATITRLSSDELLDILPIETPITVGKLAQQNFILNIDYSTLEKKLLVCADNTENSDLLITNLAKQASEKNDKSVIFDIDGTINAENKLIFGQDFKLPLNYDTINFIYEHDLNDVEPTSKAIIQDIFLELQEYSKTVLDNFIPFDSFLAVIDSQFKTTGLPELGLLKNRMLKYKEENIFAQSAHDIHNLRAAIRGNLSTLVDISNIPPALQNLIINSVYNEINSLDLFVYSFVKINSEIADKKLVRKILSNEKIFPTIICPHSYKYIFELKERCSNMIMFAPQTTQHDFAAYNVFLNKLNNDEFIIYGKATQFIPLILENLPLEDLLNPPSEISKTEENEAATENNQPSNDEDLYSQEEMLNDVSQVKDENSEKEIHVEEPPIEEPQPQVEEEFSPENSIIEESSTEQEFENFEQEVIEEVSEQQIAEDGYNEFDTPQEENNFITEPETIETSLPEEQLIQENELNEPIEEEFNYLEQAPEEEISEPETLDVLSPEELQSEFSQEVSLETIDEGLATPDFIDLPQIGYEDEMDTEIIEETENHVEETFDIQEDFQEVNTGFPELVEETSSVESFGDTEEPNDFGENFGQTTPDNLTEADLDYIDDSTTQTQDEEDFNDLQNPDLPIYPAEQSPINQEVEAFEPGDKVFHPKYGEGIVEKMVKYGNKPLCSINFEKGRRVIDPAMAQIRKI